jgi:hypothetical protein
MHAHSQIMHIPTLEKKPLCKIEHGGPAKVELDGPRSCINNMFSMIICIHMLHWKRAHAPVQD